MNLELKKRIKNCLIWSVALYAAETWTLTQIDGLLHEIIEGSMRGRPTRWRRRIWMLHDLASDNGCCTEMSSWAQRRMETQRKDV